jgi:hypothetical protein
MNLTINISESADTISAQIKGTTSGEPYTASLSGPVKMDLVDGLLWYALNRKIDWFVATAITPPDQPDSHASFTGYRLALYVTTTPLYMGTSEMQARIMRTIANTLPELEPLIQAGPDPDKRRTEFESINALTQLLRNRIADPTGTSHLLDPFIAKAA